MAMCFLLFAISPFSGGKGDDWWRLHILHLEKIGLDMLTQRMSFLLLFALLIADSVSTKDLVLAIFSPPSWVVIASGMVQDVTGTVNHNLTHEPSEQRSIGKQSEVKTHTTERKRGTEMAQSNSRDLYHSHAEVPLLFRSIDCLKSKMSPIHNSVGNGCGLMVFVGYLWNFTTSFGQHFGYWFQTRKVDRPRFANLHIFGRLAASRFSRFGCLAPVPLAHRIPIQNPGASPQHMLPQTWASGIMWKDSSSATTISGDRFDSTLKGA